MENSIPKWALKDNMGEEGAWKLALPLSGKGLASPVRIGWQTIREELLGSFLKSGSERPTPCALCYGHKLPVNCRAFSLLSLRTVSTSALSNNKKLRRGQTVRMLRF